MSGDASGKNLTKKQMINNVLKDVEIHNTSVVLMHDAADKDKTAQMLPELLRKLKKSDVSILAIDEDTPLVQHVKVENRQN
jgi:peptidoglycan/xylan/chitin deacetylase (PgdA/CDA1 family)